MKRLVKVATFKCVSWAYKSMVQNISDESHVSNHENVKFQFFNEKIVFKWE